VLLVYIDLDPLACAFKEHNFLFHLQMWNYYYINGDLTWQDRLVFHFFSQVCQVCHISLVKFIKFHVITFVLFYSIKRGIEPLAFISCCINNLDVLHPHMLVYTSHFRLPNPQPVSSIIHEYTHWYAYWSWVLVVCTH
jgi:hypothetical protein